MRRRRDARPTRRCERPGRAGRTAVAVLLLAGAPCLASAERFPDDAEIRAELRAFVESHRGAPGVVVALIDPGGRRIVVHGASGRRERPQLDGATRFEIGSITKTFTGTLLAELALAGEVSAGDPVGALFPPSIALANGVEDVTLEALATHTSGLPRIALDVGSLARLFKSDPYGGSTADEIFRAVAKVAPERVRPAEELAYSNLGVALLGQLLARRAGIPYEELLRRRVLEPRGLGGMATAHVEFSPAELARGHGPGGRPAPYWHLDGYAPAGCLLASADELLAYVALALAAADPAMVEASRLRRIFRDSSGVGLGWMHNAVGSHRLVWHNGGTGGFRSFAGFLPDEGRALVVLANGQGDVDQLARRLIDRTQPPLPPYDESSAGVAMTVLLLVWGPFLVVAMIRSARQVGSRARATDTESASEQEPPERSWRRGRSKLASPDRFDVARRLLSPAIALVLAERLGAWLALPHTLWWLALAATLGAFGVLAWESRRLSWLRPEKPRTLLRGLGSLFELGVLALLLA